MTGPTRISVGGVGGSWNLGKHYVLIVFEHIAELPPFWRLWKCHHLCWTLCG